MYSYYQADQSISKMQAQTKNNPEILQSLYQFCQATSTPSYLKMIEAQHKNHQSSFSRQPQWKNKSFYKKNEQLHHRYSNNIQLHRQKKVYQLERRIPFKQDLGLFGLLVKFLLIVFIIIFWVDFYFQYQNQLQVKKIEIAKCYQDYHQNNCLTPVQAILQQCKRLEFCSSRDPQSILKLSNVFIRTIVGIIQTIISNLQIVGMIFVIVLVVVYLNRPTMYQEEKVYKYQ